MDREKVKPIEIKIDDRSSSAVPPAPARPDYFSNPVVPDSSISSGKPRRSFDFKITLPVLIISILLTAGLSVGITYFLMSRKNSSIFSDNSILPEKSDANVSDIISTDGSESKDDVIAELDKKIASSSSDSSDSFDATISKVSFLFDYEDYDSIKKTLDSVSESSLTNFQLYQLYSAYSRYYSETGDSNTAASFDSKAAEAEKKYLSE
ncbi:hypothetical protein IJG10_00715 [Candidatus Saccharibacteria bacterium]|nr:hypothetical protein [Candidatus Saccharibacteria bacterium]MBQ6147293.1 hypothetical protein [Candidatus Saccharibacteria bacterium]